MNNLCKVDDILPLLKNSGLTLREHQINGIETILKWINNNHGGILADEMGLGKTCQAVIALDLFAKSLPNAKFLIICPLSVIEHWENELTRFGCGILKIFTYKGYKDTREKLRPRFSANDWNICLTTYTYFRLDHDWFNFSIEIVIIDEAHSVKSQQSQLHQLVRKKQCHFYILLTGTPIQNNLNEFYSLLSLADNKEFDESAEEREKFFDLPRKNLEKKLKEATEKYVLRRLKSEVCKELPTSQEVILLHSLTSFQKQLYNAVLVANHGFFEQTTSQRQSLMNVLAQLRKAVAHPYLFPGVEPEPFTEGEHLITASGKFMVLDKLLKFLKAANHRCLVFSQYSRNLEILADALSFRGYKYEHLDGSTKAEDRFQSIDNFQRPDSDIFCFLISTKAGGQGLTLTAADTVIFLDSDYNPQNDLQAAARCHRIGQNKPVKVIRLLAEHTIDNVIRKRAEGKLKLSDFVLDDNSGLFIICKCSSRSSSF
uniref:Helicase n=1 Tax=Panagrolaimus superbus TaxID=310955 RepID=A0A914Y798_9BILA